MKSYGFAYTLAFGTVLAGFTLYAVLDTFVIPHKMKTAENTNSNVLAESVESKASSESTEYIENYNSEQQITSESVTESNASYTVIDSYSGDNVNIEIRQYRENYTDIYVADVNISDSSYLKTAFAENSYGRNIKEKTSAIASESGAILAINGDFYGSRESGYVIRNGTVYRNVSSGGEDLAIMSDGTFKIINENEITADKLVSEGAEQVLSFGPALTENSQVTVSEGEEVGRAMESNPRTAIGIYDSNHYAFVVSDGRTDQSSGLSLYQLAQFMNEIGVKTSYNLDGGGSSTMYFNGNIINNPTTNGGKIEERSVSDIVYIG